MGPVRYKTRYLVPPEFERHSPLMLRRLAIYPQLSAARLLGQARAAAETGDTRPKDYVGHSV